MVQIFGGSGYLGASRNIFCRDDQIYREQKEINIYGESKSVGEGSGQKSFFGGKKTHSVSERVGKEKRGRERSKLFPPSPFPLLPAVLQEGKKD